MTPTRAQEFGEAWNGGDAERVASFFAEDGVYHASVGPEPLGATYVGRAAIARGVQAFFDRFPGGRFENLRVVVATSSVAGDIGTFEWDFVAINPDGTRTSTAGCDLLEFDGDLVKVKNAFRKQRG